MNLEESKKFIAEVLQGLWPRWEPSMEELKVWNEKLALFDYEKARKITGDLFCKTNSKNPPVKKIIGQLRYQASNIFNNDKFVPEPGQIYGNEARDKAFADILNGPDTKTRRWLVKYLEKRYPPNKHS